MQMSDEEQAKPRGVNIPVTFHVPEGLQSHYAHNMFVQPGQREINIFFFETQVPLYMGDPADNIEFLREHGARFECVGKMIVAPGLIPEMIQALQTGLDNYNEARANEEREANR